MTPPTAVPSEARPFHWRRRAYGIYFILGRKFSIDRHAEYTDETLAHSYKTEEYQVVFNWHGDTAVPKDIGVRVISSMSVTR